MQTETRRIIMLGPDFATHDGLAAVLTAYRRQGLFERWPIEYIPTHRDGSARDKAFTALRAFVLFTKRLAQWQPALLHVHCASRAGLWRKAVFMVLAWLAGWPVVLHLHGSGFARFYESECGIGYRLLVRFIFDRVATVIVLTEQWRAWMTTVTSNPRVVSIPNPVLPSAQRASGEHRRRVVFAGRLERERGIHELLAAIASIRGMLPDVELICAGEGDHDAVRRHATALGIQGAVRFAGWLDAAGMRALLASADVFALPVLTESVPMSLLEAMAAGLPVVAAASGGIPDVVRDGVNGVLVPPGEAPVLARALRRVLVDHRLAGRLGEAARETIRRGYGVEQAIGKLEALYGELGSMPSGSVLREAA